MLCIQAFSEVNKMSLGVVHEEVSYKKDDIFSGAYMVLIYLI